MDFFFFIVTVTYSLHSNLVTVRHCPDFLYPIQNWPVEKLPDMHKLNGKNERPDLKRQPDPVQSIDPRIIGLHPKGGKPELISWSFSCESRAGRSLADIYSSRSTRLCGWREEREAREWQISTSEGLVPERSTGCPRRRSNSQAGRRRGVRAAGREPRCLHT